MHLSTHNSPCMLMRFSMILIMRHYPPAMPIESSVLGAMANFSSVKVDSLEPQTPQASEEHNDHIDVPSHTLYEYVWTYGMPRHPFEELATLSASLLTSYSPATKAQVSIVWRHPRAPTCSTPVVRQHHMCSADTRGALCKNHGKTNECINCLKHAHILSPIHARFDKKNSLSLDILLNLAFQSFHKPSGPWDLQGWERSYDWGINLELLIAKLSLGEHSPALWIFDDFWITSTVTQPIPRDRHPNILSLLSQILKFLWWDWLKLNGSNMFKRIIPNTWMLHDASINILSMVKYILNTKHEYINMTHLFMGTPTLIITTRVVAKRLLPGDLLLWPWMSRAEVYGTLQSTPFVDRNWQEPYPRLALQGVLDESSALDYLANLFVTC